MLFLVPVVFAGKISVKSRGCNLTPHHGKVTGVRVLTIFGLLLMLAVPHPPAQAAFPSCQRAACCCGDRPACPCTAGPQEPKPAEPTHAAVEAPAPQAEVQVEVAEAVAPEPILVEPLPLLSRPAVGVFLLTCTFRC